MPPRGEKRRAYRGCTYDPCPGCHQDTGMRRKDDVCDACRRYINAGHRVEEEAERALAAGGQTPVWWHEVDYAGPNYYGLGLPGIHEDKERRDHPKALQRGLHELVLAASSVAPERFYAACGLEGFN